MPRFHTSIWHQFSDTFLKIEIVFSLYKSRIRSREPELSKTLGSGSSLENSSSGCCHTNAISKNLDPDPEDLESGSGSKLFLKTIWRKIIKITS